MYFTANSSFLPRHFFVFADDAPQKKIDDLRNFTRYDRGGALYGSLMPLAMGSGMAAIGVAILMNAESFGEQAIGVGLTLFGSILLIGGGVSLAIDVQRHRSARFFVRNRQYAATNRDESLAQLLRTLIMTEFRVEGVPSFATALEYSIHFESVRLILVEFLRDTQEIDRELRTQTNPQRASELTNELREKSAAVIELVGRIVNTEMMRLQKESPAT